MKKEELVKKWLNFELNQEELEAFKKLDAYSSFMKLSENAKHFKAPNFDSEATYEDIKSEYAAKSKRSLGPVYKICYTHCCSFNFRYRFVFHFF